MAAFCGRSKHGLDSRIKTNHEDIEVGGNRRVSRLSMKCHLGDKIWVVNKLEPKDCKGHTCNPPLHSIHIDLQSTCKWGIRNPMQIRKQIGPTETITLSYSRCFASSNIYITAVPGSVS